jgi:capsular exopolysaccharide synthesis family protein
MSSGIIPKVISVMSTQKGEGKTTISAYFAMSLAKSGHKVALIDLNLRAPELHRYFKQPDGPGLSDVLLGKAELKDVGRDIEGGYLISAGSVISDPVPFIESRRMKEIIDELRSQYDVVILDTPSLGDFIDGLFVSKYSEYIIYVVGYGEVSRNRVKECTELFKSKSIGIVFNKGRE